MRGGKYTNMESLWGAKAILNEIKDYLIIVFASSKPMTKDPQISTV